MKAHSRASSKLSHIENAPDNPIGLFKEFLSIMRDKDDTSVILMTLATLNKEFGVLNRTVLYRGLSKNENITFVTERNTMKYKDIQENPKVSIVFLLSRKIDGKSVYRQIRFHGTAVELPKEEIAERWKKEPVFSKIRSKITECGAPVEWNHLKEKHDQLLKAYRDGSDPLNQTDTYTSFEVIPSLIDFYYAEYGAIGDRIVYRRQSNNTWTNGHVYP